MIRYLVFAAVALTSVQPAVTLAAPPGSYRPAPPIHAAAPAQRPITNDHFRVPFELNVRPKSLPDAETNPQSALYRWRGWGLATAYLLHPPVWVAAGCSAYNGLWNPTGLAAAPADEPAPAQVSIGSLVDARSESFFSMSPSHSPGLGSSSNLGTTASSPVSFQYGFQTTPCGAFNSVGF